MRKVIRFLKGEYLSTIKYLPKITLMPDVCLKKRRIIEKFIFLILLRNFKYKKNDKDT